MEFVVIDNILKRMVKDSRICLKIIEVNKMVEIDYLFCASVLVIILIIVLYIRQISKTKSRDKELASVKKEAEALRGKISMIEYYHRNYREGENPYTMMRKIADVLQGYERYEDIKK